MIYEGRISMLVGLLRRWISFSTVCVVFLLLGPDVQGQEGAVTPQPSDPAALALVQDWLRSFGDNVYHCKWEYDAERTREPNFANGTNKLHIEGEWSFSAGLGSSYKIKLGNVVHSIREIEGTDGRVLDFWPEETNDGQKFRMHLRLLYNGAFQDDLNGVRTMFSPCVLRTYCLEDKWKNPFVFGLSTLDSDKTVISIHPLIKEDLRLITLQTNDGTQLVKDAWAITKADPNMYRIYHGADYETVYSNVRVKNVWLPAEVSCERRNEHGMLGSKSVYETAKWQVVGQYTVDKNTSMFQKILPPDGTLFYDDVTNTSQRIGTWTTKKQLDRKPQDDAFLKELQLLPDTPATATAIWYPTDRWNIYIVTGTLLFIALIFLAIKTKGFGLKQE